MIIRPKIVGTHRVRPCLPFFLFISFDDQKKRTKEKSPTGCSRCQKLAILVSAKLNSLSLKQKFCFFETQNLIFDTRTQCRIR